MISTISHKKETKQVFMLSFLLVFQLFALTKLVKYDKILEDNNVIQYDSKSDKTSNIASSTSYNQYDINDDGTVDQLDLENLKELLANKDDLTEEELRKYDLNGKNGFDTYDINVLKKYLNGED